MFLPVCKTKRKIGRPLTERFDWLPVSVSPAHAAHVAGSVKSALSAEKNPLEAITISSLLDVKFINNIVKVVIHHNATEGC